MISTAIKSPRLAWVPELIALLGSAGVEITNVAYLEHADPLKQLVQLSLSHPSNPKDTHHISRLAHWFARSNDCAIGKLSLLPGRKGFLMEIFTKRRLGPVMNKNPMKEVDKGGGRKQ